MSLGGERGEGARLGSLATEEGGNFMAAGHGQKQTPARIYRNVRNKRLWTHLRTVLMYYYLYLCT